MAGVTASEASGMRAFVARSTWLADEGLRMGAKSFAQGGLQARARIEGGDWKWKPLEQVADIYRGPLHKRVYLHDEDRSWPYITASDVSRVDLPRDIRLSIARTPQLPVLRVEQGWTLISSAGTIGNATYVNEQLAEFAVSQDMLRVKPRQVLAGFLFAFLSTQAAKGIMQMRTYGSVVDRIEPKHIADLPVPMPPQVLGERVHGLVESAARKRTEAARLLDAAAKYFDGLAGPLPSAHDHSRAVGTVRAGDLGGRLDAFYHVGWTTEGEQLSGTPLGDLATVTRPGIYKRIFVKNGVPVVSGIDVFQLRPSFGVRLMHREAEQADSLITRGQVLVQRSGQRYGLLGRPAYVGDRMHGWAASEHLIRLTPRSAQEGAHIFAFLRSEAGQRSVVRTSYGTSIPEINPRDLALVQVPALPQELLLGAARALALREEADAEEESAIAEVESWLN